MQGAEELLRPILQSRLLRQGNGRNNQEGKIQRGAKTCFGIGTNDGENSKKRK